MKKLREQEEPGGLRILPRAEMGLGSAMLGAARTRLSFCRCECPQTTLLQVSRRTVRERPTRATNWMETVRPCACVAYIGDPVGYMLPAECTPTASKGYELTVSANMSRA